jgi:uncharacterized protein YjbI with pentapeptide repeats
MNLEDIFRQIQVNANDLHDSSPSMQLTAHGNPCREGGVHTIGANLNGAELSETTLDGQQQLDGACGTDAKLPPGLTLKPCPQ